MRKSSPFPFSFLYSKTSNDRLSHRAVKSAFWVFALRIVQQIFHLLRLIILARILAPHDFGLLGIAMFTMATLETFSRTGFQAALIQKKEDVESYLNSTWTVLILRGIILFGILFFMAPYAATFFNAPEALSIIRVIGFAILFQAFTNIGVIYFQKELEFNKQFIYQLSGTLADFIIAVSAVLILRNVWALVFGLLAGYVARFIVSYLIHPYRPRLNFNLTEAKELFSFGKWVLGSSILVFLITQGDDLLVAKLLGVTMLGFYQMAYRISNIPATEIAHVISQVTFPVYSKLQDNISQLRDAFLKVLQVTAFLSFSLTGLIFILAADFTSLFLGEKWMSIVPAMQVLAFAGLARSIAASSGYLFYAVGKPRIDTTLQIVRLSVLAVLIYPLTTRWGITGASVAVFLSILVSGVGFSLMAIRLTECDPLDFAKKLIFPLVNGTVAVAVVFMLKTFMKTTLTEFIVLAGIGVLAYLVMAYLSDRLFKCKMQALIKESIQSMRRF